MIWRRVYFQDEAPKIGAGWRTVEVVAVGRKWARLRCPFTDARAKLAIAIWHPIAARGHEAELSPRLVKRLAAEKRRRDRERRAADQGAGRHDKTKANSRSTRP